ncbi:MauE/DoxX family redox-associated membrane protein [Streptomyces mayteni]
MFWIDLVAALCPPLVAWPLAATAAAKLLAGRRRPGRAAGTALPLLVGGPRRAAGVLRATGAVEVALGCWLLAGPGRAAAGAATALLGVAFLGYLTVARSVAPGSPCGCAARDRAPISWRAFVRAGAVALGGAGTVSATTPWWTAAAHHPVAAATMLALGAAPLCRRPAGRALGRLRRRLFGSPLAAPARAGGPVPLAASVELLEGSRAWATAAPLIRSGLLDHWEEDGWRILHYAGARPDPDRGGERPVSVVFALDAAADLDRPLGQAIRVGVVDQETDRVLTGELLPG